jgi:hypothetical protein
LCKKSLFLLQELHFSYASCTFAVQNTCSLLLFKLHFYFASSELTTFPFAQKYTICLHVRLLLYRITCCCTSCLVGVRALMHDKLFISLQGLQFCCVSCIVAAGFAFDLCYKSSVLMPVS